MTAYNNGKQAVVSGLADTEVTALFGEDGTLSGSAGCNRYNAPFERGRRQDQDRRGGHHPHDVR